MGLTAGSGIEGAGEADLRTDGEAQPKDERRLCETGGGFIGRAREVGVPGIDGAGDPGARDEESRPDNDLEWASGGAGLLDDIRLPGRSILDILLC